MTQYIYITEALRVLKYIIPGQFSIDIYIVIFSIYGRRDITIIICDNNNGKFG